MVQKRPTAKPGITRTPVDGAKLLSFTPILALGAFWAGGEALLVAVAVANPAATIAIGTFGEHTRQNDAADEATGLLSRDALIEWADRAINEAAELDLQVAVIVATIDDLD